MNSHLLVPQRPRGARRVSSENVTSADLSSREPTLVVPPSLGERKSSAHEVALAMELARHELNGQTSPAAIDTPPETTVTDKYAFAFDIDGVLIRGGRPIPEAIEAMRWLNGDNPYGVKV